MSDMTLLDLVGEYFPAMSETEKIHILYEHTGFPGFWNIPADGATPEACLRKQLAEYRSSLEAQA